MTDVALQATANGGELTCANGEVLLDEGFATAVYLSLFGGNQDDPALPGDMSRTWWGNVGESDTARQYRSRTGALIDSMPLTTGNLRRLEDAAKADLAWLADGYATDLAVTARIPALRRVQLDVQIVIGAETYRFLFTASSGAP